MTTERERVIAEIMREDCPGSTETQILATARRIANRLASEQQEGSEYQRGYTAGANDVKRSPYYDDSCDTKPKPADAAMAKAFADGVNAAWAGNIPGRVPKVPDGMALVPRVPTDAMIAELLRPNETLGSNFMREKYAAMLAVCEGAKP